MTTITLHNELEKRALHHATYANEPTNDMVEWALERFIKNPRLSIPIGWQTPNNQNVRTFVGTPYVDGPREKIVIDEKTYMAVVNCASLLGISVESLVDLAVENEFSSFMQAGPEWKESSIPE